MHNCVAEIRELLKIRFVAPHSIDLLSSYFNETVEREAAATGQVRPKVPFHLRERLQELFGT
jgi:hypothetical protein